MRFTANRQGLDILIAELVDARKDLPLDEPEAVTTVWISPQAPGLLQLPEVRKT